MADRGWMINLSGTSIPVYDQGTIPVTRIGTLTPNECFADGASFGAGWEGWGMPVFFLNSAHENTFGMTDNNFNCVDFADYASDGTSWVSVNTLKRKVQYPTVAYYSNGSKCCDLAAGSYVWLTENCTRGRSNPNYVAVTKVQTATGSIHTFSNGNGFVDLTHGGRWVNVGSILLRKA